MHGYEVCRQIAAMHPHIPLALVSGYAVQAENLVDVPVMATLQKPFRASELLALVRRLLENTVHKETPPLTQWTHSYHAAHVSARTSIRVRV